jgi:hypothetical protein
VAVLPTVSGSFIATGFKKLWRWSSPPRPQIELLYWIRRAAEMVLTTSEWKGLFTTIDNHKLLSGFKKVSFTFTCCGNGPHHQ